MNAEIHHPTPPQAEIAINRMEQKHPEAMGKQRKIINEINKQLFTNLTTHKTEDGSVLPYTTVSLSFTPDRKSSSFLERKKKKNQPQIVNPQSNVIEFDLFGYSLLKNEGHPLQRPDALYDRVFFYMGEAKRLGKPLNVTLVSMGQATGLGGKYTKEFYKHGKEQGFRAEAKHIADLANTFKPKDKKQVEDTRWHFYGLSMGALKALETNWEFAAENPTLATSTDMINPPRSPGLSEAYQPGGAQIIVGFGAEGFVKRKIGNIKEKVMAPTYPRKLEEFFEQKGIETEKSQKQNGLKRKAVLYLNVRNILKNELYKRRGEEFPFPVHVQRSYDDFINMSFASHNDCFENNYREIRKIDGNVTTDFVHGNHKTNYYRIDDWAKNMEGVSYTEPQIKKQATNSSFFVPQPVQ
jgi:hypothetical protein